MHLMSKPANEQKSTSGVLQGLKVVELGHSIAAPLVGLILGEQGADVIQIKADTLKTGDPIMDRILARGKTQVTIDVSDSRSKAQIRELLRNADVVIENFPHEIRDQLGLDFDAVREADNPHLISCSVHGFPEWDIRRDSPEYEAVAGMAGLLYEQPLKKPRYHTFPVGSIMAALYAANGILAALYARNESGLGEHIETNLYESNVFAQILQILVLNGAPREFMPLKMISTPFMGVWKCQDDRYIYLHTTIPQHNKDILELLKHSGFEKEITNLYSVLSEETMRDPSLVKSISEAREIKKIMTGVYASRTADEWEELLGKDFCCIKIRNLEEWVEESLQANNQDCIKMKDPILGDLYAPGPACYIQDHPPAVESIQQESNMEGILEKWESLEYANLDGLNPTDGKAKKRGKAPLEGVRVFDISRVIAGPFSARILAELGAEVVSVQTPKRLDWALSFHVIFNSGKDSVTLDFTTPEGREVFWKFLDNYNPNLFLQNYRSLAFSKEIGLDYETINEKYPDMVYTYVNAYGIKGEWQTRPAFEQVIQAVTGLQTEYVQGEKPRIFPFPILDMGAGLLTAFSSLLGLLHQQKTGQGAFCHAQMTSISMFLQLPGFARFQAPKMESVIKENQEALRYDTEAAIHTRIMKCMNQRFCLTGPEAKLKQWFEALDLTDNSDLPIDALLDEAENAFKWKLFCTLKRKLKKSGLATEIGLVKRHSVRNIFKDIKKYGQKEMPLVTKKDYPAIGDLTFIHTPIHFETMSIVDIDPAPMIGQQTEEYIKKYVVDPIENQGILPYPESQPFIKWLWNFLIWGLYAIRSGNI